MTDMYGQTVVVGDRVMVAKDHFLEYYSIEKITPKKVGVRNWHNDMVYLESFYRCPEELYEAYTIHLARKEREQNTIGKALVNESLKKEYELE